MRLCNNTITYSRQNYTHLIVFDKIRLHNRPKYNSIHIINPASKLILYGPLIYKNFISYWIRNCIAANFVFLHCGLLPFIVMCKYRGVKCRSLQVLLYQTAAMHLYSFILMCSYVCTFFACWAVINWILYPSILTL